MKKSFIFAILIALMCSVISASAQEPDYADPALWAFAAYDSEAQVDVFFIAPTNVKGSDSQFNADLSQEKDLKRMRDSIGMQSGIYNVDAAFWAPYYRQMTVSGYNLSPEDREICLSLAERDVFSAFRWYMENVNNGRPLIIAGFSQGAEMGLRLLKAFGQDEAFQKQLVAAYLIGWRVTEEDIQSHPFLKMAEGEYDTGVIIAFDCESADVRETIIVPENTFTFSINPLNWKTDGTVASRELNLGYVYPAGDGSVKTEIAQLCGCYIDSVRGTLKVIDVSPADYPPVLDIFPTGSYHIYDYEFFYRNLQKNVSDRIHVYLNDLT